MLFYAAYQTPNGEHKQGIYQADSFMSDTFSPDIKVNYASNLKPKTKDDARQMAIDIYAADRDTVDNGGEGLRYGEWAVIGDALERIARRFGLVREFRNEGII